ncbi:Ig-like domain-containing protein [Persephonella sp.]
MLRIKIFSALLLISTIFLESCSDKNNPSGSSSKPPQNQPTQETYNYISPDNAINSLTEGFVPVKANIAFPENISKSKLIVNVGFKQKTLENISSVELDKNKTTAVVLSSTDGEPIYISIYTPKDDSINLSSLSTAVSLISYMPYISFYTKDKSFSNLVNELSSMQEIKTLASEIDKNIKEINSAFSSKKEFLDAVYNAYLAVLNKYSGGGIQTLALNLSNLNINPHIEAFIDYENSSPPKFKIDVKNVSGKYVVVYIDQDGDNTEVFGKPSSTNPYLANGLLLKPNETGSFEIDLSTLKDREKIPPIKVYTIGNRFLSLVDNTDRWLVPAVLNINDINFVPTLNAILPNITDEKNCSLILVENVSNRIINDPTVFTKVKELIMYDKSPNTLAKITDVILSNFFKLAYENFLLKGNIQYKICLEDQLISILKKKKNLSDQDSKEVASSIVSRISDSQLKLITNILFISHKILQRLQTNTDYLNKLSNKIASFYEGDAFQKILIEDKLVLKPKYEKTVYDSNNAEIVISCGIEKVPCTEITVDWGDGNKDTFKYTKYEKEIVLNHEYKTVGNYTVTITAKDKEGNIAVYKRDIEVRKKLAIISTTPENNAEDIDPKSTKEIVIKFKENIDPNVITKDRIRFTETNLETGQIAQVPYSYLIRNNNELVITPANPLNEFSKYSIVVGPFKYTDGSLSTAFELTFETIDNRPLLIEKITPIPGSKLPENSNLSIEIEFNRQLQESSVSSHTIWLEDQYGNKVSANLSVSGKKIYITTDSPINSTYTYILKITKDITDIKNHKLDNDKEFAYSGNNSSSGIYKKVIILKDGSFVVAGEFGLNTDKPFVVVKRFSKDGKELWQYTYSSDNGYGDRFVNLKLLDDGNIAVDILNQGKGYNVALPFWDSNDRYAFRVILSPDGKFLEETKETDSLCESLKDNPYYREYCFYIKEKNLIIYAEVDDDDLYLYAVEDVFGRNESKISLYIDVEDFFEDFHSVNDVDIDDTDYKFYIPNSQDSIIVYAISELEDVPGTSRNIYNALEVTVDLKTFTYSKKGYNENDTYTLISSDDKFKAGYLYSSQIYEDIYLSREYISNILNKTFQESYIIDSSNRKPLCYVSDAIYNVDDIIFKDGKCYFIKSRMDFNLFENNVYSGSDKIEYTYISSKDVRENKLVEPIRFGNLRSVVYDCKILDDLSVICAGYENAHFIPLNADIGQYTYHATPVIKMFDKNLNLKWKGY